MAERVEKFTTFWIIVGFRPALSVFRTGKALFLGAFFAFLTCHQLSGAKFFSFLKPARELGLGMGAVWAFSIARGMTTLFLFCHQCLARYTNPTVLKLRPLPSNCALRGPPRTFKRMWEAAKEVARETQQPMSTTLRVEGLEVLALERDLENFEKTNILGEGLVHRLVFLGRRAAVRRRYLEKCKNLGKLSPEEYEATLRAHDRVQRRFILELVKNRHGPIAQSSPTKGAAAPDSSDEKSVEAAFSRAFQNSPWPSKVSFRKCLSVPPTSTVPYLTEYRLRRQIREAIKERQHQLGIEAFIDINIRFRWFARRRKKEPPFSYKKKKKKNLRKGIYQSALGQGSFEDWLKEQAAIFNRKEKAQKPLRKKIAWLKKKSKKNEAPILRCGGDTIKKTPGLSMSSSCWDSRKAIKRTIKQTSTGSHP